MKVGVALTFLVIAACAVALTLLDLDSTSTAPLALVVLPFYALLSIAFIWLAVWVAYWLRRTKPPS